MWTALELATSVSAGIEDDLYMLARFANMVSISEKLFGAATAVAEWECREGAREIGFCRRRWSQMLSRRSKAFSSMRPDEKQSVS